jgi:two-component system, NarL family, sensor histidine kinase UhpB
MHKAIKPYCLLVVEDNPGDYVLLEHYLKNSQLPIGVILHAEKMQGVPALIKETVIDIALLDLTLPDSNGVDSVITLTRLLPQTPIIVFSGLSTIEIAVESISLGVQDYLIKGEFDEKLLAKSVQYSIERKKTIEKLRESNERYEFVNKATLDTIWEWDYLTKAGLWGDGIIKVFGYSEYKLKYDENWLNEFIHPDDKEKVLKNIRDHIGNGLQNWQAEYRFRCADGTYKEVFDRGYILFDKSRKPYRMIGAMTDLTEKKTLERELVEQQLKQQKLITEIAIESQENERNELGRELHDNINQILATVKMYLGMAKSGQGVPEDLIGKSHEYVQDAMEEIRKLSHSLVAPSLGLIDLKEALLNLVEGANLVNGLQVHLLMDGKHFEKNVDKKKELMIYRIVQEQLNNIAKYANAKEAVITVKTDNGNLFLSVADNGQGFDTSQKGKGIGLKNINARVDFYSGNMNIISAPGKGCTLEVRIPR